jgi:alcohol dehydrogenase class IV
MRRFTFHNPGKLVFGEGAAKTAGKELAALGGKRALLVTDETIAETPMVETVKKALGPAFAAAFTGVVPDTGIDIIDRATEAARGVGADSVVSVGGGSSIDTAKAVAATLSSGVKSAVELIGFYKLPGPPAPHVAIPTTAGTGSECTSMAVIKDHAAGKKLLMLDPRLIPPVGILDPTLTVSMPRGITAATGMDAMTHAAEAIMSTNCLPPGDALAVHAIGMIAANLPAAVENGDDLQARGAMLIASSLAGQAFQNAYVGVVHAMAHALGGKLGIPHGLANGILLWVGMEYNSAVVPARVALIGKALGLTPSGSDEADAAAAVKAMRAFAEKAGINTRLKHAGVDPTCLAEVAALALADPSMGTNPRKPGDAGEIEALLHQCL